MLQLAHLSYTWPGVLLAQLVGTPPLMIRILSASFANVPSDVISAARSLGARALATAWHIGLPAARRELPGGSLVMLASGLEEFDKTFIVGAPKHPDITNSVVLSARRRGGYISRCRSCQFYPSAADLTRAARRVDFRQHAVIQLKPSSLHTVRLSDR
ncbi:ABC transporter permease subunit [Paraburkholderia sediminicola]|uniref:ABC transporter permease subunit n=1 Tax=Paraburkholderia sediminicola TaxID=458836 RepID=UPI0024836E5F|nr:ABC transporter permease subunit [Paraburkholderia sediminicola]